MAVVPLRSRDARALVVLLLGAVIAALALAIVFGIGVAPEPSWNAWLVAIALLAFVPAGVLLREVLVVAARPSSR